MPSPLFDATLRLKWAEEEIRKLDASVQAFYRRNPGRIVVDTESKPGRVLHRAVITEAVPDEWLKQVTRIIADLREPLDYATVAVAEKLKAEKAEFFLLPIEDSEAAFEREIKKRKIEARCPDLAVFLRTIKPYKGPNDLLFGLHELSTSKKHRAVTTIAMAAGGASINVNYLSFGSAGGWALGGGRWITAEDGLVLLDLSADGVFDGKIQVAAHIAFSKLEGFEGQPTTVVFMQMANAVQHVLSEFERQFFAAT